MQVHYRVNVLLRTSVVRWEENKQTKKPTFILERTGEFID